MARQPPTDNHPKPAVTRRRMLGSSVGLAALPFSEGAGAEIDTVIGTPGSRLEISIAFIRHGTDAPRGVERVTYTFNRDGSTTMSARSESYDPPVVRDVIYLLGPDHRPRSCHLLVTDAGRFAGVGWFRLTDTAVRLEGQSSKRGEISQQYSLRTPVRALVAHPVSTDVLVGLAADKSRPGEPIQASGVYLTSADPYGRTGPDFVAADVAVAYLGIDRVETPLGSTPGDHYLLYLRAPAGSFEPFQDLWCVADTPIFLKAYARGSFHTRYELTAMRIIAPAPALRT